MSRRFAFLRILDSELLTAKFGKKVHLARRVELEGSACFVLEDFLFVCLRRSLRFLSWRIFLSVVPDRQRERVPAEEERLRAGRRIFSCLYKRR